VLRAGGRVAVGADREDRAHLRATVVAGSG
jgi:hypothetical protein